MVPDQLEAELRQKLGQQIDTIKSISGGSINKAARAMFDDGSTHFLKWNSNADPEMFSKEQKGLHLLRSADSELQVPAVNAVGKTDSGIGFLLQAFVDEGSANAQSAEQFGKQLAALHRNHAEQYGLEHDNYIGRLPQSNKLHQEWITFFINQRMVPQLKMARDAGKLGSKTASHFESLYEELPDIFPEEPPSLLHGDLWSGNFMYDQSGRAVIYDPAVYYGHREIELAFTHLFGGFSADFYKAYKNAYPIQPGFSSRKDIYNLYPLLVHTNLFGGHYAQQVKSIVSRF